MKSRVMMVIAMAALVILVSATMAQAVVVYSENFDGPGVTPGQSVCASPLGWEQLMSLGSYPNMRIYLGADPSTDPNWPDRGFTGNFLDGSTGMDDNPANGPLAWIKKTLTVPVATTRLVYEVKGYFDMGAPGGAVIRSGGIGIGDIQWEIDAGAIRFYNGSTSVAVSSGASFYNNLVTMRLILDWTTGEKWGEITNSGGLYRESAHSALTYTSAAVGQVEVYSDLRSSPIGPDFDDILVTADVPEPGTLLALGSGLIGLAGLALRRRR